MSPRGAVAGAARESDPPAASQPGPSPKPSAPKCLLHPLSTRARLPSHRPPLPSFPPAPTTLQTVGHRRARARPLWLPPPSTPPTPSPLSRPAVEGRGLPGLPIVGTSGDQPALGETANRGGLRRQGGWIEMGGKMGVIFPEGIKNRGGSITRVSGKLEKKNFNHR